MKILSFNVKGVVNFPPKNNAIVVNKQLSKLKQKECLVFNNEEMWHRGL